MSATIQDVAKKARVSVTTVSRVLNGSLAVRPQTKEWVLRVVKELGYSPNLLARSLKNRTSHTIGLVVDNIANPFFAEMAKGIEDLAGSKGYSLFLCNTDQSFSRGLNHLAVLQKRGVDGIIYASIGLDAEGVLPARIRALQKDGVATVLVGQQAPGQESNVIRTDDEAGADQAGAHLIGLGHRRIAYVGGPDTFINRLRQKGFERACREHGLAIDPGLMVTSNFRVEGGLTATKALLSTPERPTAVFLANDLMAIGAVQAAKEAGLRVPQDLAVVGFDDISLASYLDPPLTTVRMPKYELGRQAVAKLLQIMAGASPGGEVILATELVVRRSSGLPVN